MADKNHKHIGELVVVAHWPDFDLMDKTKLGILSDVKGGYFYVHGDARGYRYCRLVSKKQIKLEGGEGEDG